MLDYAIYRIAVLLPTLLAVSLAVFLVLHLVPGDPARNAAGPDAEEEDIALIREHYGLDQPLWKQYGTYLVRLSQGDLGESFRSRRPVLDEIMRRLPATMELAGFAMLLAVLVGVGMGVAASMKPNSWVDDAIGALSAFGISVPVFFLGLLLMLLFAARLQWLPPSGRGSWANLVLPVVTLGLPYVATFARVTRSTMLEVLSEDYIRTARAKGLVRRTVIWRHALINAAIPLVTLLGVYFGRLLGGAVIVETIFAWPGLGRYMVDGIIQRDLQVVQGCILFFATAIVVVNLVVDLLYSVLDPRIARG
ncbi:ABC transporter permease [Plastoroseomonas hellenica]|uniref:ABC transporter permease n=1 Tax=Plastoroseomonas hellenica TaxID=2687306 RepID=UPI001BA7379A|nr:ABC transporter permease [Plastoroseomonas hellenica]MBR0647295.1 ABC transporter permease [Plastoroseomonas hellenica]